MIETPIFEVIFVTLTEDSSVATNFVLSFISLTLTHMLPALLLALTLYMCTSIHINF